MQSVAKEFDDDGATSDNKNNSASSFCSSSITFEEARTVIGRAFCGTETSPPDPAFAWIVTEPLREKQTPEELQALASFLMGFALYEGKKLRKTIFVGERDSTSDQQQQLMSCVMLEEYDPQKKQKDHQRKRTPWLSLTKGWYSLVGMMKMIAQDGKMPALMTDRALAADQTRILKTFEFMDQQMTLWHLEHGPSEVVHWYLCMVGVHPDQQGKGCGKRIMKRIHEAADARGIVCYLECAGEKNTSFYTKLGYKKVAAEILQDPSDKNRSLTGAMMMREPLSSN